MKWYFASNNSSDEYHYMIKAAVLSALEHTNLEPHFIYDGKPDELTQWLQEKGVNVIYHRVSFYNSLKETYDENSLKIASGTFLRCDIPILEKDDDFILYTDCDVIFLENFDEVNLPKPEFLSCATESTKNDWSVFNAGIMVMNINKLKESYDDFLDYTKNNLSSLISFDQGAYNTYYLNKNTKLPLEYNWKPYWGVNKKAKILHFHGPKPHNLTGIGNVPEVYDLLLCKDPLAYIEYIDLFTKYSPESNLSILNLCKCISNRQCVRISKLESIIEEQNSKIVALELPLNRKLENKIKSIYKNITGKN